MKIKAFYEKWREVILYLAFGVLTTVVGLGTYSLCFVLAEKVFHLDLADKTSAVYLAVYTTAQVVQWLAAILFSFFTNRKWVFEGAREGSALRQLIVFAGGRVATLGLDVVLTYVGVIALTALLSGDVLDLYFIQLSAELVAKLVASVAVVIDNYFISKWFVFKKK